MYNLGGGEINGGGEPTLYNQPTRGARGGIDFEVFYWVFTYFCVRWRRRRCCSLVFYAESWVAGGEAGARAQVRRVPLRRQWKKA